MDRPPRVRIVGRVPLTVGTVEDHERRIDSLEDWRLELNSRFDAIEHLIKAGIATVGAVAALATIVNVIVQVSRP